MVGFLLTGGRVIYLICLVGLFITAVVVYVQGGFLPESLGESLLCFYILVMLVWSIVRVIERAVVWVS